MAETVLALILAYRYAIIPVAAFFASPLVSLICGGLIRGGILNLVPTILALALGELAGDALWYYLGYRYGEGFALRYGRFFGITSGRVDVARELYRRFHGSIIVVSKITAGFGIAPVVLITAGLSRVPFRRYMLLNAIGQVVWTGTLLALGYYLGHFFLQINSMFTRVAFAGALALAFLALTGFGGYLRGRFTKTRE